MAGGVQGWHDVKYRVTAEVEGEQKARQMFAPDRTAAGRCATILLGDPTVKEGTVVEVWEERSEVVERFVKKGKDPGREPTEKDTSSPM